MSVILAGVNHKTAPIELRERLAIAAGQMEHVTRTLLTVPDVQEAMVLSTCNRVEFLTFQPNGAADLAAFAAEYFAIDPQEVAPHVYVYRAEDAVRHLFRVAASLDSLVVGEPQILGQVKEAWTISRSAGAINSHLDPLLQRAFMVARKVRAQTSIGVSSVSIASVAVDLARKIFGDLAGKTVLLTGAGKMGELAAKSLMHQGATRILFCNRTQSRAEALAERFRCAHGAGTGGQMAVSQAVAWDALHRHAAEADIVVTCTGAGEPIFTPAHARTYAARRKHRPIFFIDIAVPRDVDPDVNRIEGVFVYNIDDLQAVAAGNLAGREKEAQQAEAIIAAEVDRYSRWVRGAHAKESIVSLTQNLEDMRQHEMRRAAPRLASLSAAQRDAVEQMTRALVHKLQHGPIQALKRAAREGDLEALAAIEQMFSHGTSPGGTMPLDDEGEND